MINFTAMWYKERIYKMSQEIYLFYFILDSTFFYNFQKKNNFQIKIPSLFCQLSPSINMKKKIQVNPPEIARAFVL